MQRADAVQDFTLDLGVGPEKLAGHQEREDEERKDGEDGIKGNGRRLIGVAVDQVVLQAVQQDVPGRGGNHPDAVHGRLGGSG